VVAKLLDLHRIIDNYTTYKTKAVQAGLTKHPRFKLHFAPTSASSINLVEGGENRQPHSAWRLQQRSRTRLCHQ
jgi:hypothetical protein